MIKVFPTKKSTTSFVFKDSHGKRQQLSPMDNREEFSKLPQCFNGEDYAVAVEIRRHLDDKTVTVSPGDKAILAATLKGGSPIAESDKEPDKKATKAEVKIAVADALAEAEESHKVAADKSAVAAQAAQAQAVTDAVAEAEANHRKAIDALQAGHEKAIKKAGK